MARKENPVSPTPEALNEVGVEFWGAATNPP